jgi:transposase
MIILLAYELNRQKEIARAVRCSRSTVARTLKLFRLGGRGALPRRYPSGPHFHRVTLAWQKLLALAMEQGPEACGVPRPAWTAPLLAEYLAEQTQIRVSERTVRRYLRGLDYRLGRPTYSVRHKAEEQEGYHPKKQGSKRC